jgi:DNA-binding response OmpR family regulator
MNVLLVEDDLDFQRCLADLLVREGHMVEAVGDGAAALERVPGADVLVTDIGIPGLNGLELCRRALFLKPALTILVMTGCDSPRVRAEASMRGAAAFLAKPFEAEELLEQLRRLEVLSSGVSPGELVAAGE